MKVIIGMLTYNLEKYVSVAIESVLQQKVNFKYKLLIADDCSTDSTVKILKRYKEAYPDKIDLILAKMNGGCAANALRIYERLDSEYFAILDGDDLWIGDDKLQRQVDFLDNHPEYSMCAGQTRFLVGDDVGAQIIPDALLNKSYSFRDFFATPALFHVSGLLYRNAVFKERVPSCFYDTIETFENCASRGEDLRRVMHLEYGDLYALSDVVSLYRIHSQGIWSGSSEVKKALEGSITCNFYRKYYRHKYPDLLPCMDELFNQYYMAMWQTLVNNKHIIPKYSLTPKEDFLLRSLLEDLSKENERDDKLNHVETM